MKFASEKEGVQSGYYLDLLMGLAHSGVLFPLAVKPLRTYSETANLRTHLEMQSYIEAILIVVSSCGKKIRPFSFAHVVRRAILTWMK